MYFAFNFGTTTIVITGTGTATGIDGVTYTPDTGTMDQEFVAEKMTLIMSGTGAALIALRDSIAKILEAGFSRQAKINGTRAYFKGQLDGASVISQSEIVDGITRWRGKKPLYHLNYSHAELEVSITRRNYWEDPEIAIPISNVHGTDQTAGLQVDNIWNGTTKENRIEIDGADLTNTLPTPAKLLMENTYNSANRNSNIYMFNNVESSPTTFTPIIEGEDLSVGSITFTTPIDATRSGGNYGQWDWTGGNTSGGKYAGYFALSSALLGMCKGQYVRFLAVVPSASSGVQAKIKLSIGGLTTIAESGWTEMDGGNEIIELASFQLPPLTYEDTTLTVYPLQIDLFVRDDDGTAKTLQIDFFYLAPKDGGSKTLVSAGYNWGYQVTLTDDPDTSMGYTSGWATAGILPNYVPLGEDILLYPGISQAISFLWEETAGHDIARTINVVLKYSPRRLML